jgi:hypothetical protein
VFLSTLISETINEDGVNILNIDIKISGIYAWKLACLWRSSLTMFAFNGLANITLINIRIVSYFIKYFYFSSPNNSFALLLSNLLHIPATAFLTLDSFSSSMAAIFETDFGESTAAVITQFKTFRSKCMALL